MPSTYSGLKFELIATGEQLLTWGDTTNTNVGTAIEQAIAGYGTATFATDADTTLGYSNSNTPQTFRNMVLNVTSAVSLTLTRNLVVPTTPKMYFIFNNTTGSQSIVVKTSAGSGITVPNGAKMMVYCDGTNVVESVTRFGSLSLGSPLSVANGGTGAATLTGILRGNGTGAFSAAVADADYLVPPAGTAILKANSGGALANAVAGTDFVAPNSNTQLSSLGVGTAASGTTGEIRATNNVTAFFSSDARLKENVAVIADPLYKLNQINGVTFDWTQEYIEAHGGEDGYFVRRKDVGLIAQEVEAALPELVVNREDGYKALKYDRVVALLVEAVKELHKEVVALKGNK